MGDPSTPPQAQVQLNLGRGKDQSAPPNHHDNQIQMRLPSSHLGAEADSFPSMEY